jgi:hypothetical protein
MIGLAIPEPQRDDNVNLSRPEFMESIERSFHRRMQKGYLPVKRPGFVMQFGSPLPLSWIVTDLASGPSSYVLWGEKIFAASL